MNEILKVITCKINPDGDCSECECSRNYIGTFDCRAFDTLHDCIDFLRKEDTKVYCQGCKNFRDSITYGDCGVVYTDPVRPFCNSKDNKAWDYKDNRKDEECLPKDNNGYFLYDCKSKKEN